MRSSIIFILAARYIAAAVLVAIADKVRGCPVIKECQQCRAYEAHIDHGLDDGLCYLCGEERHDGFCFEEDL